MGLRLGLLASVSATALIVQIGLAKEADLSEVPLLLDLAQSGVQRASSSRSP